MTSSVEGVESVYGARLARAQRVLSDASVDGLLVTDLLNVRHLCGFTGSNGLLVVGPQRCVFFTDSRYTLQAREQTRFVDVCEAQELDVEGCKLLETGGVSRVGVEEKSLSVGRWKRFGALLPSAVLCDVGEKIDAVRKTKDPSELGALRAASALAEEALLRVLPLVRVGVAEETVALAFHLEALKLGAETLSFATIVAGGPRGALPHAVAGSRRFENGDLVVIDFGVRLGGYCSDQTVTVPVGTVAEEARRVYDVVAAAQQAAVAAVRPGVPLAAIDQAARDVIRDAGFGEFFGHGTGHGVGLAVHEAPTVSHRSKEAAEVGMVFTIEPGIYLPGRFGVRLEDCLVVTVQGCELLTSLPKDFGAARTLGRPPADRGL